MTIFIFKMWEMQISHRWNSTPSIDLSASRELILIRRRWNSLIQKAVGFFSEGMLNANEIFIHELPSGFFRNLYG